MNYTTPTITDYGDVRELTAQRNDRLSADVNIPSGDVLGDQNSTGRCFATIGGVCIQGGTDLP